MEKDLSFKGGREEKKLRKERKVPQSRRGGVGPSAGSAGRRGGNVRCRGEVLSGGCTLSPLERVPAP